MWYCKKIKYARSKALEPSSTAPQVEAGKYRELIEIQKPQIIQPDGGGGGQYGWSPVAKLWAQVTTYNVGQRGNYSTFEEGQLMEHNAWEIVVRYDPNIPITTSMRILFKGRILQIDSIVNVTEYNVELALYCTEAGKHYVY